MRTLRIILVLSLFCLDVMGAAGPVLALDYPNKPITVIGCYPAGGDSDMIARLWAQFAEQKLGQPVLVVNKVGGGGITGTAFAAAAISSGLMLLVELPTPRHWAVRLAAHTSAAAVNRILFFIASGYLV